MWNSQWTAGRAYFKWKKCFVFALKTLLHEMFDTFAVSFLLLLLFPQWIFSFMGSQNFPSSDAETGCKFFVFVFGHAVIVACVFFVAVVPLLNCVEGVLRGAANACVWDGWPHLLSGVKWPVYVGVCWTSPMSNTAQLFWLIVWQER